MSIHRFESPEPHAVPPHAVEPSAFDEREWQLQERALHDERAGAPSEDPALAHYRRVARALRAPMPDALPADFAARIAARAQARRRAGSRVEDVLTQVLLAALGIAGGVFAMRHGAGWLQEATALLPREHLDLGLQWGLAILACLGLSWSMEHLRRTPRR